MVLHTIGEVVAYLALLVLVAIMIVYAVGEDL